jgi:parallel beta-helix repeat protein
MNNRLATILAVAVVICGTFPLLMVFLPSNASATVRFVGGMGVGNFTSVQDAVNVSIPGDTIFVYNGTYLENIVIPKSISLVGESKWNTVIDGRNLTSVIRVSSDSVTIRGFTITNSSHHSFVTHAGILIQNAQSCLITDNILTQNLMGAYVGESQGTVIAGNDVSNNVVGISIDRSGTSTILNNTILGNELGVYLLYSTTTMMTKNTMVGNQIEFWGNAIEHWNTHSIDTTNTLDGRPVRYWKNLIGGTIPPGAGQVILANCMNVVIENQDLDASSIGVQLGYTSGIVVRSNTFHPSNLHGIRVFESHGTEVINNTFLSNWHALTVFSSTNLYVSGNDILGGSNPLSWQVGFSFNRGGYTTLEHNYITGVSTGIHLQSIEDVSISENIVSLNEKAGIRCENCVNTFVVMNEIDQNGIGIHLSGALGASIYHNTLRNNDVQALDDRDWNAWDNGYPSGGNHWGDYTGFDSCSGPSQDVCPDSDGIGDTPHLVDIDSVDRYPLMSPIDPTRPRPPFDYRAILAGSSSKDVLLQWATSSDDGSGLGNVRNYYIYRSTGYDPLGMGYQLLTVLPNGTSEYTDPSVGAGDPNSYFYRICSVDAGGNMTCARNQAGKFIRPLPVGFNIVSVPLIQSDTSIEWVLQTVQYDKAWSFSSTENMWKSHMPFKPFEEDLRSIDHTMGVWLSVTENSSLTVAGAVPTSTKIQLLPGWNLVGFPSFNMNYTVGDLRSDTGTPRVEGLDEMSQPYYLTAFQDGDSLLAGRGYWIYSNSAGDWTVSNL